MTTINLDGPHQLAFDYEALKRLEAACNGQPLGSILTSLRQLGLTTLEAVIWVGLQHEDPEQRRLSIAKRIAAASAEPGALAALFTAAIEALDTCPAFAGAAPEPA